MASSPALRSVETTDIRPAVTLTAISRLSRFGPFDATAFAAVLLLATATSGAQSVTQPGFETPALAAGGFVYDPNSPTPGQSAWTFLGASGIANIPGGFSGFLSPPEGSQVAFLQTFGSGTTASVCQDITGLLPDVEFFVSAALATRVGCGSCVGPVDVEFRFDGNLLRTVAGGDIPGDKFARFSAVFIPAATNGQLCIAEPPLAGFLDATSFADDVRVGIFHIFIDGFEAPL